MRSSVVNRLTILACGVAVIVASRQDAQAQTGSAIPASAANAGAPGKVKRVPISKAVFGDAGVIVNARDDGFIEVAAAGPQKTVI